SGEVRTVVVRQTRTWHRRVSVEEVIQVPGVVAHVCDLQAEILAQLLLKSDVVHVHVGRLAIERNAGRGDIGRQKQQAIRGHCRRSGRRWALRQRKWERQTSGGLNILCEVDRVIVADLDTEEVREEAASIAGAQDGIGM